MLQQARLIEHGPAFVLSDILCVSGRKLLNTLAQNGKLEADDVLKAVRGKTKFSKEEMNGFSASVEDAVEAISYMLKGDTQKAMNLYNKKGIGEGTE